MKLCTLLTVLSVVAVAQAVNQCSGTGRQVTQFNGRKEAVKLPCKYHAVRQRCGAYDITMTPGNVYLFPKYRLDSMWLSFTEIEGAGFWEGRTDNKLSVKYYNGWTQALFNKKNGNLTTEEFLTFGKDSTSTWAEAKNGDFRVTFVPWDPEGRKFRMSTWKFECFDDNMIGTGYPDQICGSDQRKESTQRMLALGMEKRDQAVYYDILTNTQLGQTNPKCINATRLMTEVCTEEQRRDAMKTCTQILSSFKHTKCVSKYTCEPMDTFVDCIDWVCSGYQDKYSCERVGHGIDMCRTFKDGNLTAKVEDAKCFKHFLNIISN